MSKAVSPIRRLVARSTAVVVVAALGAAGAPVLATPAAALSAPVHFSAAPLPTDQVNGVVWATAYSRGKVFAGGAFKRTRPAGQPDMVTNEAGETVPNPASLDRVNFAVLDAGTGLTTSCRLDVTLPGNESAAVVRSMAVSPSGDILYLGGLFGRVNGQTRSNVAAINVDDCTLNNDWRPTISSFVTAITVSADAVYLGGAFGNQRDSVGNPLSPSLLRVAAVNPATVPNPGAFRSFRARFDAPEREDGTLLTFVYALALSPDGTKLVVGGNFDTVNGANSRALGVVDAVTGATVNTFPGLISPYVSGVPPVNRGSAVKSIAVDSTGFYTGNEGTGTGVFDGRLALNWDGTLRWRDACLGATQAVTVYGGLLYGASHAHDCSSTGSFGDGARNHFHAQTTSGPAEQPTEFVAWWADTNDGVGEMIGPRTLTVANNGDHDQMWSGGEFTRVLQANGTYASQQGLTRFGRSQTTAPTTPGLQLALDKAGQVRVTWRASWDRDDTQLTYRVFRSGTTAPLHTVTGRNHFWNRGQFTYVDSAVAAGTTATYTVTVNDGVNTVSSAPTSVTVPTTSSPYAARILADDPTFHLRFEEPMGVSLVDATDNRSNFTRSGAATYQVQPSALVTEPTSRAMGLDGLNATLYSEKRHTAPTRYSIETWIKTSTTAGGQIIGLSATQEFKGKGLVDKVLYMTTGGQVIFGTEGSSGKQTLTTPTALKDSKWHHLVATQDETGMTLYVDGAKVARNNAGVTKPGSGFWKIGGNNLQGDDKISTDNWPSSMSDAYWQGSVDETAVYPYVLSPNAVAEHFALAGGTLRTGPTDAYGKTVYDDEPGFYWRLNDASGTTALDSAGPNVRGTYAGTVTYQQPGGVTGTSGGTHRSVKLNGSSGMVRSAVSGAAPSTFSAEAWVRTASASGGQVLGFGSATSGDSGTHDRQVWFRNDGRLSFAIRVGSTYHTVTSDLAYNDDRFHHVVATRDASTMRLYVDGAQVGSLDVTGSHSYTGYWRFGGDNLSGLPSPSTSKYLNGWLDEVAVYNRVLSPETIAIHHSAGNNAAPDVAPPSQPGTLTPSVTGQDVSLTWRASLDNVGVTGYEVHRSATAGFTSSDATRVGVRTVTSFVDAALGRGTWFYRVVALDAAGNRTSSFQASVHVADTLAPTAPTGLTALGGASSVGLNWTAGTDNVEVADYVIHRSTTAGFTPSGSTQLAAVTATTFTDEVPTRGTYYYRVLTRDTAGNVSQPTPEVSATVADDTPPTAPADLVATTMGPTVNLTWTPSTDNGRVTTYEVHRSSEALFEPSSATLLKTSATAATTDAPGLGTWYYEVRAFDAAGNGSAFSNEVRVFVATTVTVPPSADAYVTASSTSANFGIDTSLRSRGTSGLASYLRFQVPPVIEGTRLTSAILRLRTTTESTAGSLDSHLVRVADDTWDEATVTWNTRPAVHPAPLLGTVNAPSVNTTYDTLLDLTAMQALTGSTVTLALTSSGTDNLVVWSRNHATVSQRPQLILSFAPEGFDPLAPTQPKNLAITRDIGQVHLTWTASTDDEGTPSYQVHRGTTAAFAPGPETRVGTAPGAAFTDVPGRGTWFYRVIAQDAQGHISPPSDVATVTVPDYIAPTVPTGLAATLDGPTVTLSWNASTDDVGVAGYALHRSASAGFTPGPSTLVTTVATPGYVDTRPAGTWYYAVTAADALGNTSAPSGELAVAVVDAVAPTAPADLAAVQVDQTVELDWTASTDAFGVASYEVHRSTTAGFTPGAGTLLGTSATPGFTQTAAPVETAYFTVLAVDPSGNTSLAATEVSVAVTDVTPPAAPTEVVATPDQPTESVALSWAAATDNVAVARYQVHRSADPTFVPGALSLIHTTADATTLSYVDASGPGTWYYSVVAVDTVDLAGEGSTAVEAFIADVTDPSDPADLVATVPAGGDYPDAAVDLAWTGSTDDVAVAGYQVHRSATAGFTPGAETLVTTATGTTYQDRPGQGTWHYVVIAVDTSDNTSAASGEASATLTDTVAPTAPTALAATQPTQPVALTWTAASDAFGVTGYRIYRSSAGTPTVVGDGDLLTTVDGTTTSYADPAPLGQQHYVVVAVDAVGNRSAASDVASLTVLDKTAPSTPVLTVGLDGRTVQLSWTAATDNVGVTGYRVYRATTAGADVAGSTLLGTVAGLSTTDSPGAGTWHYRVLAVDAADNAGELATSGSATLPDIQAPTAPGALAGTQVGATASLTWTASTDDVGVVGYAVHRSATAGFTPGAGTLVGSTTTATSFVDSPGAGTWRYRVVATDAAGNAQSSAEAAVTLVDDVAPTAPTALTATESSRSVVLAWTASTDAFGVTSYDVHRSRTAGFTPTGATLLTSTATTGHTDSLPGAGTWYYTVVARDAVGNSSTPATHATVAIADIQAPTAPVASASASGGTITVSWTGSTDDLGVVGYRVHRSSEQAFTPSVANLVGTYGGTPLLDNPGPGTWYYRVIAVDAAGNASDFSNEVSGLAADVAPPAAPASLTASAPSGSSSVTLSWPAATDDVGVVRYQVHRFDTSGFTPSAQTLVTTTTGTTFVDAPPAATWYYRVLGVDAAGNLGDPSPEATASLFGSTQTVTVLTTADTYAAQNAATSNFATSTSLRSNGGTSAAQVAYLRFALPAAPAGAVLTGAQLRLRTTTDSTAPSAVDHRVAIGSDTWTESTLTWNNRPTITGPELGTFGGASGTNTAHVRTLDAAVLADLLGSTQTVTLSSTGTDGLIFWSANYATASERPRLLLTFATQVTDTRAPSIPSAVAASTDGPHVTVTWGASTDNVGVTGYDVHRSTAPDFTPGSSTLVATVTGTSFTQRLAPGGYVYKVRAKDATGNVSAPSAEADVTVSDDIAPTSPGSPSTSVSGTTVTLAWAGSTDAFGVTGYELHRSDQPTFDLTDATLVTTVGATNTTDSPGVGTWYYRVVAVDAAGNQSVPSGTGSATVSPPPTVVTLTAVADTYANQSATGTNYGTSTSLRSAGGTSGQAVTYVRFSVPAAPAGASLTGAVLRLRTTGTSGANTAATQPVRVASNTWSETTLTWNNRPAVTTTLLGTVGAMSALNTTYSTTLDRTQVLPLVGTTFTAALQASTTDFALLHSRNAGTASHRPQLVLTYEQSDPTPPTPPSGLTAGVTDATVQLSWTAATDNVGVTGYEVHRSTSSGFTPSAATLVGTPTGNAFSEVVPAGTYSYLVRAKDAAGNVSAASNQATAAVVDGVAPTTPGTPSATVNAGTVALSWTASADAFGIAHYELHRSSTAGFTPSVETRLAQLATTSTADSPGLGTWYYRVVAVDGTGNRSLPSGEATATVTTTAPPEVVTVVTSSDSYASEATPTTNYGSSGTLRSTGGSGVANVSYLRFVVPAAPTGKSLTGAVLRVRTTTATDGMSADAHAVRLVSGSFTETGLTWNNRPAVDGALLGTLTGASAAGTVYEIALTPATVASSVVGRTVTLAIQGDGTDTLNLWSRNYSQSADHPRLVLSYT